MVRAVLDRWLEPEHRYFKVAGGDDRYYLLRYATTTQYWEVSDA